MSHMDKFEDYIRKTYKLALAKHHPDRGGDATEFKKVQGAFNIIMESHIKYKEKIESDWKFEQSERERKVVIRFK